MILGLGLNACGNNENAITNQVNSVAEQTENTDETTRMLTSEKGDTIYLTYFPKGDVVAVKLKIGEEERILEPYGSSEKGNPVLTDGEYGWEMFTDGRSGRLFTKESEGNFFKER